MADLRVGQVLLFVHEDPFAGGYARGRNETIDQATEITVERIGRKWAHCSPGYRVDRHTLAVSGEGYSSPGRCYLSREHYAAEKAADAAWRAFLARVHSIYRRPPGLTAEAIRQAMDVLGLQPPEDRDV